MSQNSTTIVDSNGVTFLSNLNLASDTLRTNGSGASAPSSPSAGWPWMDTTNNVLKIRNASNTVWKTVLDDESIHASTSKTTPVDADELPLLDSAASFGIKKLTWANIKATLKTYLDTLYVALTGDQTIAGIKTFTSSPIFPTPTVGDSSTKGATTAYVQGEFSGKPSFSAYRDTSAQSITTSTATKVQFQTEEWDTTAAYDNATNFRFQPTKAGYYQVNACLSFGGSSITRGFTSIRKNGNEIKRGMDITISATSNTVSAPASASVYLNGSTDYIEIYGYCTATSPTIGFGSNASYFQAYLILGA